LMRKIEMLCPMVVLCSGLALAGTEQSRPNAPAQNKAVQPQAQIASSEQKKPVVPSQEKRKLPGQDQGATAEQHKAVVRRVFDELFSRGRYEFIDQIYAKDCAVHTGNRHHRLSEAVAEGKGWRSAAPDLVMTTEQMSVNGDIVTVSWTAKGTNTGKGNGVPATGKHIVIRGSSRFRLVNGKIAEVWNEYDRDEVFRQVGVNPKLGHLYDMTQDFAMAVSRVFFPEQ
jgi:steroid delta-isomerase-like uncharacterized protein